MGALASAGSVRSQRDEAQARARMPFVPDVRGKQSMSYFTVRLAVADRVTPP